MWDREIETNTKEGWKRQERVIFITMKIRNLLIKEILKR